MNKGKKKPGAGWIILGILSGYYTLANLDGVQRVYSFLFRRGPQADSLSYPSGSDGGYSGNRFYQTGEHTP